MLNNIFIKNIYMLIPRYNSKIFDYKRVISISFKNKHKINSKK